jgi:REP element-mobilizing transposase RayT
MEKILGKYRNDSTRLGTRDYAAPGSYFVTIITRGRKDYFGKIGDFLLTQDFASPQVVQANGQGLASPQVVPADGRVLASPRVVQANGQGLVSPQVVQANGQAFASLRDVPVNGQYLVQLTEIGKIADQYWQDIPLHFPFVILEEYIIMPNHVHGLLTFEKNFYPGGGENLFAPQSKNLASVIRGYKAAVKKYATLNKMEFAWQPRYHERIVRLDEMTATRRYIRNNPTRWLKDHSVRTQDLASPNAVSTEDPAPKKPRPSITH